MFLFAPIRWLYKLVRLIVIGAIIYVIVSAVQVVQASNVPGAPPVVTTTQSAIVTVIPSTTSALTPDTTNRLEEASLLLEGRVAGRIIVVRIGVLTPHSVNQVPRLSAETSLQSSSAFLVAQGVPRRDIRQVASASVYDGFVAVSRLLPHNHHVIVITDGLDALWTEHAAAGARLDARIVRPANSPNRLFIFEFGSLWRQATGVAAGRVIGFGNTSWVNG